jgi:hypothetical protein
MKKFPPEYDSWGTGGGKVGLFHPEIEDKIIVAAS